MEHCKPFDTARSGKDRREIPTCADHSGIQVWIKGVAFGVTACAGLLSFSVFWQAPTIRAEMAREINRLDTQDVKNRNDLDRNMEKLGLRVSTLEIVIKENRR